MSDHNTTRGLLGCLIAELREARGWSQTRLADEVCLSAERATVTRHDVSRWERGTRVPGPFWLRHLAGVLEVPLVVLEAEVKRRRFLAVTATVAGGALVGGDTTGADLVASIAGGDSGPLARVQTSYQIDLTISALTGQDRPSLLRLTRWAEDADSPLVRVNASGIIAKTHVDADLVEHIPIILGRDQTVRDLYISAVMARVGDDASALGRELRNPRDAGARWCAAHVLAQRGDYRPIRAALHTEPIRENLRSYALLLNGDARCT